LQKGKSHPSRVRELKLIGLYYITFN